MTKSQVVVFTKNNARIINNPDSLESYKAFSNSLVDPDLSEVRFFPPHHWKLVDGKVKPMDKLERDARDVDIETNGAQNETWLIREIQKEVCPRWVLYGWAITAILGVISWLC